MSIPSYVLYFFKLLDTPTDYVSMEQHKCKTLDSIVSRATQEALDDNKHF
jgi:hypothetical protein